jgi:DNA-binding NarL/FixJ family response regulator
MIKVLIADDHAVVRDGLKSLLNAESDIEVMETASNGREAVRKVEKLKPDVVIMDIAMPELNGLEATIQAKKCCPSVKVIILSMHDTSEHIFQGLRAGATGYLLKESAGKEVIRAVRKVHDGFRYLSQAIQEKVVNDYIKPKPESKKKSPLELLSSREREILQLVVEGKSSAEIADILFISQKTVETYRSRLMQKLDVKDIPSLVKFAIQHGITTLDTSS